MSMSQSDATINCILNLCKEKGYIQTPKETIYKDILTKEDTTFVVNFITLGLIEGDITMTDKSREKFKEDKKGLRRYVVGLVNDRLRKAKVLNGNVTYKYKNPGKLTQSKDPELKSLLQVMDITTDPLHKVAIQVEIDRRKKELDVVKKVTIDYSLLPESVRKMLEQTVEQKTDEEIVENGPSLGNIYENGENPVEVDVDEEPNPMNIQEDYELNED